MLGLSARSGAPLASSIETVDRAPSARRRSERLTRSIRSPAAPAMCAVAVRPEASVTTAAIKAQVTQAQKTRADGALGISRSEYAEIKSNWMDVRSPESAESLKWLEREQPGLYAALTSDLDYDGYTGVALGSLNATR